MKQYIIWRQLIETSTVTFPQWPVAGLIRSVDATEHPWRLVCCSLYYFCI